MRQSVTQFLILALVGGAVVLAARLPADVQKCHYAEDGCIVKTTNYILGRHYSGIPESNLISLDPITVGKVDIIQGPESPVNVRLQFKNLDILGLKNARIDSAKGFTKNFEGVVHEMRATVPRLELLGDYTIDGRVLILPIQGEGRANITMENIKVIVKATGKNVVSKGNSYFQADKVISKLEPGKMQLHFENLYRGDKRLGDSTNLFLNENWQDIYKELRPSVEDTFAQVLTGVINNFFAKNKYNTLFLE